MVEKVHNLSPLDSTGHSTHYASIAAGSYVNNVQYSDLNMGSVRGGAPLARLAIYKVCWKDNRIGTSCAGADILAGIDDAIKDGVDIMSVSIGGGIVYAEVHEDSALGLGFFHAVSHGIPVVAGGGNSGPDSNTISNVSPWIINVAASNSDKDIITPLTLGNNKTIIGNGFFKGNDQAFAPLIIFENITSPEEFKFVVNQVKGKVVMLSIQKSDDTFKYMIPLKTSGVLAVIVAVTPDDSIVDFSEFGITIPLVTVDFEQGNQIFDYFQQCKSNKQGSMIKLGPSKVVEGKEIALKVAKFSSRGPNSFAPEILKPDVAAPGVNILAATRPPKGENGFQIQSGTSMATPHVSGIIALLKVAHPDWSPAAIKSALVTTGDLHLTFNIFSIRCIIL
ncbi:hypothetical protein BC332_34528 [Capsicum chinense]|nr:hypothetical protein BC332_34528 [Capsicum chinense]